MSRFREKRKWQIAFRRYVVDKSPSPAYAPYFGLDITTLREWFEGQFGPGITWEDFGKKWQFDHIIPVACFDLDKEEELKLCWYFLNLRVDNLGSVPGHGLGLLAARSYFREIHEGTGLAICRKYLDKIDRLEALSRIETDPQINFLKGKSAHLAKLYDFSAYELELLNRGRSPEEILQERELLRKLER